MHAIERAARRAMAGLSILAGRANLATAPPVAAQEPAASPPADPSGVLREPAGLPLARQ